MESCIIELHDVVGMICGPKLDLVLAVHFPRCNMLVNAPSVYKPVKVKQYSSACFAGFMERVLIWMHGRIRSPTYLLGRRGDRGGGGWGWHVPPPAPGKMIILH